MVMISCMSFSFHKSCKVFSYHNQEFLAFTKKKPEFSSIFLGSMLLLRYHICTICIQGVFVFVWNTLAKVSLLVGRQKASSSSQNQVLHFNKFSPHPEIPHLPFAYLQITNIFSQMHFLSNQILWQ